MDSSARYILKSLKNGGFIKEGEYTKETELFY